MVLVKAGVLAQGDPTGIPAAVEVDAFYIDVTEVTNERYHRFASATGHIPPKFSTDDAVLLRWTGGRYPKGRGQCPVVLVTCEDAEAYAVWAGKRLPTQTEWEYAARGPKAHTFPWGDAKLPAAECGTADRLAGRELLTREMWQNWYNTWSERNVKVRNAEAVRPVGSFPKDVSVFGCFDMAGSVREWCVKKAKNGHLNGSDPEAMNSHAIATDSKVVCGSSWLRDAGAARAWVYETVESSQYYDVGLRCVVSAADPAVLALARQPASKPPDQVSRHR